MTTLGFIRHGITAWNKEGREQGRLDIPLHQDGIVSAQLLAKKLADEHWDAIFTSPLARAQQTAEIIAQQFNTISVQTDMRLCEIGTGLMEGTTEQDRIAQWGLHWRNLELGIEPEQEIIARCQSFLDDVKQTYPNKRILVVSHGDLLRRLLQLFGYDLPRMDNTALTIIQQNQLLLFNYTAH
ncbi:histidine phosphatase family protein [Metasolibacillus sp.]|uniref:histidine phosphatase family protein n=1 Tax=Metasolibacillus sp. TaxID=2703680 RepID=UPI0025F6D07B|nr:histidine phosphatase family protein [Metasolibacillus sp.]MCT6925960.1 histidine phosphatase family protein [Metasolibacillus sp.]MCT6942125.1 histidine phosphatase family protein [Metasolibacillus sp.]